MDTHKHAPLNVQITLGICLRPKIARKKANKRTHTVMTDKTVKIFKWNYLQRLKQKSCLSKTRVLLKNANQRSRVDFKQNKRNREQKNRIDIPVDLI